MQWRLYILTLVVSDMVMTGLAFWLAFYIRFRLNFPVFNLTIEPSPTFYPRVILAFTATWLFVFFLAGLYHSENLLGGTQEYAMVFRGTAGGMLVVMIAGFLEPTFIIARGWLLIAWTLVFLFVASGRFWLRRVVYAQRRRGYFITPAIVIGANAEGKYLVEQLWNWRTSGLHLVGVVDDEAPLRTQIHEGIHVLGRLDQLDEILARTGAKEILIATSALSREKMLDIFERYGFSERVNLHLSSGLFEVITTGLQIKELAYIPLVHINRLRLTGIDRAPKLAMDYGLTIPALILLSPLLLLIAIVVKLDSPGGIFFRRRVMGVNGSQFDALKFRSMYANGDEILAGHPHLQKELQENHKLVSDPRVTRVGHFLRRFSLDELPQLINVLRHEMSLVGPRMISPPEMAKYDRWGMNLLTVRPGITGLWQVSGRSDVNYDERVRLDMHYIRNWTIWLDLQLLFRTIPAVLRGVGAY